MGSKHNHGLNILLFLKQMDPVKRRAWLVEKARDRQFRQLLDGCHKHLDEWLKDDD